MGPLTLLLIIAFPVCGLIGFYIKTKNLERMKLIERLEANERHIILLFYLGEKSIKEINTITDLSKSNIKVILHRARKKLYKHLKPEYEKD